MDRAEIEALAAHAAYGAYFAEAKGRSLVSGERLPVWGALGEPVQRAWVAAARAARHVDLKA